MKGRIAISRELCKGCTYCAHACAQGVIVIDGEFNAGGFFPARVAFPENCTGCALCGYMCPEIAIEVWREDESEKEK